MMNRHFKLTIISLLLAVSLGLGVSTLVQAVPLAGDSVRDGLNKAAETAEIEISKNGEPTVALGTIAGKFINYMFGIIGMIFVMIMLIGAYLWMIARGSEEKIAKAKTFLLNGFFGLMVIFIAWGMAFVISNSLNAGIIGTNR